LTVAIPIFETFTTTGTPPNAVITSSNLNGKRVENAPRYIQSWTFLGKNNISTTLQYRLTGKYLRC
jgi:Fe(3+) dicitrate transport protein